MKTETQIAEENIKKMLNYDFEEGMQEHKASCQRFLGFLEDYYLTIGLGQTQQLSKINPKITDLKQAIKEYEKNGI